MDKSPTVDMAEDIGSLKPIADEVSNVTTLKSSGVDSALTFLRDTGEISFTLEEEETLISKIDWILMPPLAAVYFLQFLDKNLRMSSQCPIHGGETNAKAVNFANIMGLGKDTHTSPSQFSNLALSFWVSYLACEPLAGYLLQKLPVGKFLAVNGMSSNEIQNPCSYFCAIVILWGLCVALNCVCKDYVSLVTLRVLLGIFESCVSPRYECYAEPTIRMVGLTMFL